MSEKIIKLNNLAELEQLLKTNSKVILFKHSTSCPISSTALSEYKKFVEKTSSISCAYVEVIENRELSNAIASNFGITHESPQVLLFSNNSVIWNTSHRKITEEALQSAIEA